MWVSELMETAGSLYKKLQGASSTWHWNQGRDRRESSLLWLRKGVLSLCQGGGFKHGHTQALMILVSYLASPQYVLLLFSDGESVCQGKQCYSAGQGHCCFSLHSSLHMHSVHMQPSVFWLGPQQTQTHRRRKKWWKQENREPFFSFGCFHKGCYSLFFFPRSTLTVCQQFYRFLQLMPFLTQTFFLTNFSRARE